MKKILFLFATFVVSIFIIESLDLQIGIKNTLLPKPGECGTLFNKSRTSIIGHHAELGEYPWTALIAYLDKDNFPIKFKFTCNGVLINENHILAPSKCADSDPQFVRLGDWNTGSDVDCNGDSCANTFVDITVETTFFRSYDTEYEWHDNIGLIRLSKYVTYTEWILPICLPTAKHFYASAHDYTDQTFTLTGFNENTYNMSNEIKFKSIVRVVKDEFCEQYFNFPLIYYQTYDKISKFCINITDSICRGGGIVMAEDRTNEKQPYMYAVGFYAYFRNQCLGPQQVERIIPHMHWITYEIRP